MSKVIEVYFPGGKKVDALVGETLIKTDQPVVAGGEGSAAQPFELFLASLATCAGIYALSYCQTRKINTENMELQLICDFDTDVKRYTKMTVDLKLPTNFPEKHTDGIVRAMDLCAVKKYMMKPPEFEIKTH